ECVHCYQDHTDKPELSTDEVIDVLDQLAAAGVLFLTLMGGEFFMRRDADLILRAAHDRGFAIKLLTTGHHIGERRADLIASLRPIQVDMSLYGARPEVHEAVTRQPGSWQRTYRAARLLIARRIPVLLKAPAMDSNAGDLAELAELARDVGAEYSFDPNITSMESGGDEPIGLRMSAESLRAFYRDQASGVASFLADTIGRSEGGRDPRNGAELRPLSATPCRAGQQAVSIGPQGQVKPCNGLPVVCGDLREQSFEDIWTGSAFLGEIRQLTWASIAECNVCQLRAYCHRCHGMALLEQGQLRGPSLEACRHAVAVRDSLRERGLVARDDTALPPTWDRVDPDGRHPRSDGDGDSAARQSGIRRSPALRVLY
ncbi:MAG: radical SAM protein, partial [Myxococcota bacterium]